MSIQREPAGCPKPQVFGPGSVHDDVRALRYGTVYILFVKCIGDHRVGYLNRRARVGRGNRISGMRPRPPRLLPPGVSVLLIVRDAAWPESLVANSARRCTKSLTTSA